MSKDEMRQDASGFLMRVDRAMEAIYRKEKCWNDLTLGEYAKEAVSNNPSAPILRDGERWLTREEILNGALKIGSALCGRGLKQGDVLSMQLPNWHEAAMINLAAALFGFVINPIVPIQRDREVGFTIREARSRVIFIPHVFRGFDYSRMLGGLVPHLEQKAEVIIVRGDSDTPFTAFEQLLTEGEKSAQTPPKVDADALKMIMYTSGTTGWAKGVLHSHNTLMAEVCSIGQYWKIGADDKILMGSPVSHIAGTVWALELPWVTGCAAVMMDIWNGDRAAKLIDELGCSVTSGATVFLQDLLAASQKRDTQLPSLRHFICGGAPVPPELVRRAYAAWPHCLTARVYGSTEASSVTYGTLTDWDPEIASETDGKICNWDVRISDLETGQTLPDDAFDVDGEILVRGPELCLGYTNSDDTLASFDNEGFFRTGDIGRRLEGDYLAITDRKKDIIIRGGENLSAREIEDALSAVRAIRALAVVAMPCERMGEKACAFIELNEGHALTKEEMVSSMKASGLARQKIPEELIIRDSLPRTASGKIKKNDLRDLARAMAVKTEIK